MEQTAHSSIEHIHTDRYTYKYIDNLTIRNTRQIIVDQLK